MCDSFILHVSNWAADSPLQTSPSSPMICLQTLQCLAFLNVFTRKVWEWRASSSSGCSSERATKTKEMKCYICGGPGGGSSLGSATRASGRSVPNNLFAFLTGGRIKPKVFKNKTKKNTSAFLHPDFTLIAHPHLTNKENKRHEA